MMLSDAVPLSPAANIEPGIGARLAIVLPCLMLAVGITAFSAAKNRTHALPLTAVHTLLGNQFQAAPRCHR